MRKIAAILIIAGMIVSLVGGGVVWADPDDPGERPLAPELENPAPESLGLEASAAASITLGESGWSDPTAGTWDPAARVATLTRDLSQGILVLTTGPVLLDGNGHTLTGTSSGNGVDLTSRTGVEVRNLTVRRFMYGFLLSVSSGNTISGNTCTGNGYGIYARQSSNGNTLANNDVSANNYYGIYLDNSRNNSLSGNTANGNGYDGIRLLTSSGNILSGNTANNNARYGIVVDRSGNSTLTGNTMAGNRYNLLVDGTLDSEYGNTIDTSNQVEGRPVYYVRNETGTTYDGATNAGIFYLVNCTNVTLRDLTPSRNGVGIFLWRVQGSRLENIQATNNSTGIWLRYSDGNTLARNTARGNSYAGIFLQNSSNNQLISNVADSNSSYGIYLEGAGSNVITYSNLANNSYGVYLSAATGQRIYNNNFINNTTQSFVNGGSDDLFYRDPPFGGNYWSNYVGRNENGDAFYDDPYAFTGGEDRYAWTRQDGWADGQAPTTTASLTGTLGNDDWYISPVLVTLTAVDNEGGSGVKTTEYGFNGHQWNPYTAPVAVSNEGTVTIYFRSTDNTGNVEPTRSQTLKIDLNPPVITGVATAPANGNGWYNTAVTIDFSATDSASGVDTSPSDVTLAGEGANQSAMATATDHAGHSATYTLRGINIDRTAPTLTFGTPSPAPNAAGWNKGDVSVPFTAQDNLSGVATTTPPGNPLVLSAEGAAVAAVLTVSDRAGNSATFRSPAVKIDKTPPTITINTPQPNAQLAQGTALDWTAADALSGLSGLTAMLSDGTSSVSVTSGYRPTPGSYTLLVEATDVAGNRVSAQRTFSVYNASNMAIGAGLLNSPAGSYPASPRLSGTAVVSFLCGYRRDVVSPYGFLFLRLRPAKLDFRGLTCESVVINGTQVLMRGSGTVNGAGSYGFLLSGLDRGNGTVKDKLRIKIWDKAAGNQVVYDNQPGAADGAAPTVELSAGGIQIISH